ncbi:DELLA protein GAI-like [Lycium ferocissimum]|uniref:DELLA protein GAI-like n=1 Tax=Lycium ferocissimum TaxID=112874 RepID=UPI00281496DC|nr:DELLA protein GAI-like [Lycium ferocissimum]
MSSREMSMDTITEDSDSFVSNTDAIIFYGASDFSVRTESSISGPNIPNSSSTSVDDYDHQQQISTAAAGSGSAEDLIISSSASSSSFNNTNKQSDQQEEIRIFNVDFRSLSRVAVCSTTSDKEDEKEFGSIKRLMPCASLLPDIGQTVSEQPNIFRLVNALMACAKAVQQNNICLADALIRDIKMRAISQIGAMKKVVTYFAQALDLKIHGTNVQDIVESSSYTDELLHMSFHETCPYLRFAHCTANDAIFDAFANCDRVHVIDFSFNHGCQWPAFVQALALRPGGPPAFRLTGIGPLQADNTDAVQEVGSTLAQLAETFGVEFEFRGFVVDSLADLDASMLNIRPSDVEAVAVNSVFELHNLLFPPGANEKVLNLIKQIQPKIVVIAEPGESHYDSGFIDKFNEAWYYYLVDSRHGDGGTVRVVRHEALSQWRVRMNSAGFNPVHLGSNACIHAAIYVALLLNGEGYRVEEEDGCLMLSWHSRPLTATSAWQLMSPSQSMGEGDFLTCWDKC